MKDFNKTVHNLHLSGDYKTGKHSLELQDGKTRETYFGEEIAEEYAFGFNLNFIFVDETLTISLRWQNGYYNTEGYSISDSLRLPENGVVSLGISFIYDSNDVKDYIREFESELWFLTDEDQKTVHNAILETYAEFLEASK